MNKQNESGFDSIPTLLGAQLSFLFACAVEIIDLAPVLLGFLLAEPSYPEFP